MTQPPYGGAPPPDGPPYQDPANPYQQPGYGQPAYPPAVDPYATPDPGQPAYQPPPGGYPPPGAYPPPGQPVSGDPYTPPGQPMSGDPYTPPGQPVSGDPYATPGQPYTPPTGQPYAQPMQQPYPAAGFPPPGQPGYSYPGVAPPPKKKRGALIGAILAVVLVLCAGGGISAWLLLRNVESGDGAPEPVAAVESFLKAVYTDNDVDKAAALVCAEARDDAELTQKVNEIKGYKSKYDDPTFEWDEPKVDDRNNERAIVSVKVTMVTADEKTAEQDLKFTVVQKTGWFICEVG
jgi:hypothetical protein